MMRVEINIWDTITAAWHKVYGVKASFWTAFGLVFLIGLGLGIFEGIAKAISPGLSVIIQLITNVITYLLQVGILYMGIMCALDKPITYKQIFFAFDFDHIWKLIGVYILQMIIFAPAIIALIVGGILASEANPQTTSLVLAAILFIGGIVLMVYLLMRIMLGISFVIMHNANPLDAIKMSFRATNGNVINLVCIFLLQIGIVLISVIPLGIGLIWTLPFSTICFGVIYKMLLPNAENNQINQH